MSDDQPTVEVGNFTAGDRRVPQTDIVLRYAGVELVRKMLPPGEYVIGRHEKAAVRADTALLSREHARLTISHEPPGTDRGGILEGIRRGAIEEGRGEVSAASAGGGCPHAKMLSQHGDQHCHGEHAE